MPASGAEAAAVKTFGDLPLMILTAKLNSDPAWQKWQTDQLQLSSNSQQRYAENSGPTCQVEQPDAAAAAIIELVQEVRQTVQK